MGARDAVEEAGVEAGVEGECNRRALARPGLEPASLPERDLALPERGLARAVRGLLPGRDMARRVPERAVPASLPEQDMGLPERGLCPGWARERLERA